MEYSQEKRAGLNHVRFADEELIKTQVLQGEAAQTIIQGENCSVYKMENETGEGVITRYPVFPGIELLYDDIHMSCGVAHREDPRADLLEINHCRLGRFECEFSDGSAVYLGEGDLAVNVMTNQTRETWFPLSHYRDSRRSWQHIISAFGDSRRGRLWIFEYAPVVLVSSG